MASSSFRFEVTPKAGQLDPIGQSVLREARAMGIAATAVKATHIYFITGAVSDAARATIASALLADAVAEQTVQGTSPIQPGTQVVEVHPLPGVMDPVAQSVEMAIHDLVGIKATVTTGWRYDITGVSSEQADALAKRALGNPVIQRLHRQPVAETAQPKTASHEHAVAHTTLTTLSDDQLTKLSREAHLFLSLDEMKAVQAEYKRLGREPTDVELETLAQTWSEHCVHKTLKARVRYVGAGKADVVAVAGRAGHTLHADGSVTIENLLKSTVAAATFDLIKQGVDWTLSVFKDNSGVIAFDDQFGICIKVETHNRPSAIEPYGGAATGIGGCIRDVIGTGLGALPIAGTDIFCVAMPSDFTDSPQDAGNNAGLPRLTPKGLLHPERTLKQVVAGVRDYGNRMGIPTVSGGVFFDNRYIGNPLVFVGCIGLIPNNRVHGAAKPGDRIIAMGGRTGRDGVHGATFSSAGLENNAADEFAHAVQIGNAIEEKRVLDAIMRARDQDPAGPLYNGMTDCGAGGFSSAIGEMGSKLGAEVHLDRAPLKYDGLSYTEIWISEAQERMVLAVPPEKVERLRRIATEESVEIADLGHFGTPDSELLLNYKGTLVGRMSMDFMHDGIPTPVREAAWNPAPITAAPAVATPHIKDALLTLLSHPNIASKHWIIRQYDHEVRGGTVIKPLTGPTLRGPSDASVIAPVKGSNRAIGVSCGLQTWAADPTVGGDPYQLALLGIDEAVRNLVCTGADPDRIAILDNFCWPSCNKPENLGALVRACEGCYDGAMAYRTPFVSGKDSLNNQFTTDTGEVIEIPYTLLITGLGIVPDLNLCVTTDAKAAGNILLHIGSVPTGIGGSHAQRVLGNIHSETSCPGVDLVAGPKIARAVAKLVASGRIASAHDVSDGGILTAIAEMLIGGSSPLPLGKPIGAEVTLRSLHTNPLQAAFSEGASRYVLEATPTNAAAITTELAALGILCTSIGTLNSSGVLTEADTKLSVAVGDLTAVWSGTLDW